MLLATMPLTMRHGWIVFVASLGQLIGTGVATLAGIMISMIEIISHPELSPFMQGLIGSADLIGIVIGSLLFGRLSDKYGYIFFFRLCPFIVLISAIPAIFIPNVAVLTISLFFIGLGIGGEYSLDSNYISELLPVKWRSLMIGIAKTASAFGNIAFAGVCYLLLIKWNNAHSWPNLMWIIVAIAAFMLICRIWFYQSPKWLVDKGEVAAAEKVTEEFLGKNVEIAVPDFTNKTSVKKSNEPSQGLFSFCRQNFKQVMISGVPWACEGLGVYGIGVFLPILIMALGIDSSDAHLLPMQHVITSVKITFWVSCIILPGFIIGLWLINRKIYLPLIQFIGFLGSAGSLLLLLVAYLLKWDAWIAIIGLMGFELFLNLGPHLITYVLPPKIYPVNIRGRGTGIAAALGKVGAVLAVFLIPMCLDWGGATLVLIVSIVVLFLGGVVTKIYAHKVLPPHKS